MSMKWKKLYGLLFTSSLLLTACGDPEDCATPGDEDGNGAADCDDEACVNVDDCQPQVEDCNVVGDQDGGGEADDCDDPDCANEPNCVVTCGNGAIDAGETCDGNNLNNQDCTDFNDPEGDPFIGGNLACNNNCQVDTTGCAEAGDEICDNGINDNDDDNLVDCADPECVAAPNCVETNNCDDNIDNDGDGLTDCADVAQCAADAACVETGECADNADNDGDGLTDCADADCAADPACDNCGNGNIDAGEACDGNNLNNGTCALATGGAQPVGNLACDNACQFDTTGCAAVVCNNDGVVDAAEQCDDGTGGVSNGSGDGCDDCAFTPDFEQEANNTSATANNFAAIDVVPAGGDGSIRGEIGVVGDLDFFSFSLTAGTVVRWETSDENGPGNCGAGTDTVIRLFDVDGTSQLATDDEGSAIGNCSLLNFVVPATGVYFLQVEEFLNNGVIDGYTLTLTDITPTCGDGVVESGEICDGAELDGEDCTTVPGGFNGGTLACNATCDGFDTANCTLPVCGDDIVDGGEQCEPSIDGAACDPATCLFITTPEVEGNDDTVRNINGGLLSGNDFHNGFCDDTTTACNVANAAQNCGDVDRDGDGATDGVIGTGACTLHNDPADVNADGPFNTSDGSVLIAAAIDVAGDEDSVAVFNDGTNPVRVTAETFGPNGFGTCDPTLVLDTVLNVRDEAGAALVTANDDGGEDFCSLITITVAPGETVFVETMDRNDNAAIASYFLQLRYEEIVCGDGIITAGAEQCDDGQAPGDNDGCSAACQIEPGFVCDNTTPPSVCRAIVCGDGLLDAPEQCDDGNPDATDGCSDTCTIEPGFICNANPAAPPATICTSLTDFCAAATPLVEGANAGSFDAADGANFIGTCNVAGGAELGDREDLFTFTFPATGEAVLQAVGDGGNTGMTIYARSDCELAASERACSSPFANTATITVAGVAGETITVFVEDRFQDGGTYTVNVTFTADVCDGVAQTGGEVCDGADLNGQSCVTQGFASGTLACNATCDGFDTSACSFAVCGNGLLEAGEECEISLLSSNCEDLGGTCNIVGSEDEIEPNNNAADADANGAIIASTTIVGSITEGSDELDHHRIDLAAPSVVRFETFTSLGDCAAGTTTTLRLFTADGTTQIVTDSTSGIRSCSALVMPLDAGTYYIQVEETGTNLSIPQYILEIAFQEDQGSETEAVGTIGINDNEATAELLLDGFSDVFVSGDHPANDNDFFLITLPPGTALRAEVVEAVDISLAADILCNAGVNDPDFDLRLFNPGNTTAIVSDDADGRGFCAMIDGTGSAPLDAAAANNTAAPRTVLLAVRGFAQTDLFAYRLVVTVREGGAFCGDGIQSGAEACDDGANGNGDGCEDNCTLTPACGNGVIEAGEDCETPGVGFCDATCQFVITCAPGETLVTQSLAGLNLAIPDGNLTGVNSVINIPDTGNVQRVFVTIDNLTHTFDGDVDLTLIAPNASTVDLSSDNGGGNDNYINTTFEDECSVANGGLGPVTGGAAPFTGCFIPEGSLATLEGQSATGDWTLNVVDDDAILTGTLNAWTLNLCIQ